MTYRPPSARYHRFSSLLRQALDPRFNVEERDQSLRALAWSAEELAALVDDPDFRSALNALNAPHQVERTPTEMTASSQSIETPRYNGGADLRQLINEAFDVSWHIVGPEIEDQTRVSDRAIVCARAVASGDSVPSDDLARGVAWTQLIPGTGLLRIWQAWPDDTSRIEAYLQHSLDRGASRRAIPRRLAIAITRELASRPRARAWFDAVVRWAEAWVVAVSLAGRTPAESTRHLQGAHLMMRVGLAKRATNAGMRSPRVLALAELASSVTLIRAAARVDLIRAYREAGGDPRETVRAHERHDRRAELLFEAALGAVLRPPRAAELTALTEDEQRSLAIVGDVLHADPGLSHGILADLDN